MKSLTLSHLPTATFYYTLDENGYKKPDGTVVDKAEAFLTILAEIAEMNRRTHNNTIRDFEHAIEEGLIAYDEKRLDKPL